MGFPINVALGLEVEGKGGVEDRGETKHLKQAGSGASFLWVVHWVSKGEGAERDGGGGEMTA